MSGRPMAAFLVLLVIAGATSGMPAVAEEQLPLADEQAVALEDGPGESGGEPSAEDAPVEGEPGPGEAIDVPPDEPVTDDVEIAPPNSDESADKPLD